MRVRGMAEHGHHNDKWQRISRATFHGSRGACSLGQRWKRISQSPSSPAPPAMEVTGSDDGSSMTSVRPDHHRTAASPSRVLGSNASPIFGASTQLPDKSAASQREVDFSTDEDMVQRRGTGGAAASPPRPAPSARR